MRKAEDALASVNQYAGSPNILMMVMDAATIRKEHPEYLNDFVEAARKNSSIDRTASPEEQQGEEFGRELAIKYLNDTLERLEVAVVAGKDDTVGVTAVVAPGVE